MGKRAIYSFLLVAAALSAVTAPRSALCAPAGNVYTLEQALRQALKTHPQIRQTEQAVNQAREQVDVAFSEFLPHVNYNYQRGGTRIREPRQPWRHIADRTQELRVEQSVFAGGSDLARVNRARLLVEASEYSLDASEQATLLEAAAAYIRLYSARKILQSIQKNLGSLNEQLNVTQSRFEVSDVTVTDLSQAEARRALAEANYRSAQEQLRQAIASFRRVMGSNPPNQMAHPVILYPMPQTEDELIAALDIRNPRIHQINTEARAANETVSEVQGELLPQVSLIATSRRSKGDRFVTGLDRFDEDALLLNVTVPIYQGGGTWARMRAAQYAANEAKYTSFDTHRAIREAALLSWESYKAAELIYDANLKAVEAAREALRGMREEYNHGQRTLTDLLDAERELSNSEVSLWRSEEQRLTSAYEILSLLNAIKPGHNGKRI